MITTGKVVRTGILFALFNFVMTAAIGLLLRYHLVFPITWLPQRNWIHAHSHIGFLGWVYVALITMAYALQMQKNEGINRRMYRILIYTELSVLGMLFTFPFMGYAAPSIFFSTMHMVFSIIFTFLFFRNAVSGDLSVGFTRAALVFMLISGFGPLALGPLMALDMQNSPLYDFAVYFYLHFQYNGWFTLAIFGLFFKVLENSGLQIHTPGVRLIMHLLIYTCILTLALSALGFGSLWFRIAGGVGAILQIWAGYTFLKILHNNRHFTKNLSSAFAIRFFGAALAAWLLKITMQFVSVIPDVTTFAYFNREAIMTYLHLTLLAFVSNFIIGLLIIRSDLSVKNHLAKFGYWSFLVGVVFLVMVLGIRSFPQLLGIEMYLFFNKVLLAASLLVFISTILILINGFIIPINTSCKTRF